MHTVIASGKCSRNHSTIVVGQLWDNINDILVGSPSAQRVLVRNSSSAHSSSNTVICGRRRGESSLFFLPQKHQCTQWLRLKTVPETTAPSLDILVGSPSAQQALVRTSSSAHDTSIMVIWGRRRGVSLVYLPQMHHCTQWLRLENFPETMAPSLDILVGSPPAQRVLVRALSSAHGTSKTVIWGRCWRSRGITVFPPTNAPMHAVIAFENCSRNHCTFARHPRRKSLSTTSAGAQFV